MIAQTKLTVPETFPPFSLSRLLKTVFNPSAGERVAILIDLDDPHEIKDFGFLKNPDLTIQRHAYEVFHLGLKNGVLRKLGLRGGEMLAYKITGGSNLDLPDLRSRWMEPAEPRERHQIRITIFYVVQPTSAPPITPREKWRSRKTPKSSSGLAVDYDQVSKDGKPRPDDSRRVRSISLGKNQPPSRSRPVEA
jgi:hypothetical protein